HVVGQPVGRHLALVEPASHFRIALEIESAFALADLAVGYHRDVVAVSQRIRVRPRQMGFIHEVLHGARRARFPAEGTDAVGAEAAWLELGTIRDGRARLPEADKDEPISFLAMIRLAFGLCRNRRIGRDRGNPGDRTALAVAPAVIGTDQLALIDPAERQAGAAVDAEVLERKNAFRRSPNNELDPPQR